jgi:pyruvate formate lyase activating enzyme
MKEAIPLIFDIHRFALDDGPGIRTTVFLKGCRLSCSWCHNPESMRVKSEIAIYPDICLHCGSCSTVCPEAAISDITSLQIDRSLCTACGRCADSCPTTAIRKVGKKYSANELVEILLRDKHFYHASGGGVTFSGGEPTLWMNFLSTVLSALKAEGLHTTIQTSGLFDYDNFSQNILPYIDLIMFDIKFVDATKHKKFTGQNNALILKNFRSLTEKASSRILPRVPLVPNITATQGNLLQIASFLADLGYHQCSLLPYNPAGIEKWRTLGLKVPLHLPDLPFGPEEEDAFLKLFLNALHTFSTPRLTTGKCPDHHKEEYYADRLSPCGNLCSGTAGGIRT